MEKRKALEKKKIGVGRGDPPQRQGQARAHRRKEELLIYRG